MPGFSFWLVDGEKDNPCKADALSYTQAGTWIGAIPRAESGTNAELPAGRQQPVPKATACPQAHLWRPGKSP